MHQYKLKMLTIVKKKKTNSGVKCFNNHYYSHGKKN